MNSRTIVTNLRINEIDWLQIKAMAAELGMSANAYINQMIRSASAKREFAVDAKQSKAPIWKLSLIAKGRGKGLSSDDKTIYQ